MDATTRRVSSGLLYMAGDRSSSRTFTRGARSGGSPAALTIPLVIRSIAASTCRRVSSE